ncbi:WecB/TagA/CpsF family glycosyltransferase [Defluviicoccus vanus]|uniref:WecB/TagA/CpsF family glycosyltransferase n=1 Tax=Defluviicoccus vanus TaxID=111831 RepID=A0A7H1N0C9_9PROT|nr:WecB/TagA/CpsF family glycosyltransferase [Defluviicoccus vanus]
MQIASLLLYARKFPENLNGTDLVPFVLEKCGVKVKVFLFGARPDSVRQAAARLNSIEHVYICGYRDGYSCWSDVSEVINEINAAEPDIVLVALGNPVQELWIARYGSELVAPVIVGVGALFDFLSGNQKRAPLYMRRLRSEWLHRLICEPRRLWRRYTVDILQFGLTVLLKDNERMRDLELMLGRMTLEVEILREALELARANDTIALSRSFPGEMPR